MNSRCTDVSTLPERVREALDLLDSLTQFAYEKGYHECGYDPVKRLRNELETWEKRWSELRWCYSGCRKDEVQSCGPTIGGGGGFLG